MKACGGDKPQSVFNKTAAHVVTTGFNPLGGLSYPLADA
jgi:hypothetical protein